MYEAVEKQWKGNFIQHSVQNSQNQKGRIRFHPPYSNFDFGSSSQFFITKCHCGDGDVGGDCIWVGLNSFLLHHDTTTCHWCRETHANSLRSASLYMNDFRCNVSPVYFFPRLPVCQLNWPSLFSSSWSHIIGYHFSCRAIVAPYHAYVDAIQTIRALSVFQPPRHFICLLFVTRMNICGDACVRLNAHNEEKRTHIQISKNYWDCYGSNAIKIEAICRLGS